MEYLTEEEIAVHPEIARLRVGKERVPRGVLLVARRLPISDDDIRWAMQAAKGPNGQARSKTEDLHL